jgi:hypothetical protein
MNPFDRVLGNRSVSRRRFLTDLGMGVTGMALQGLFAEEALAQGPTRTVPAKVDHVIWLFMAGGVSHTEGFDPKPALTRYGGKTIRETPFKDFLAAQRLSRMDVGPELKYDTRILPLQIGYRKVGDCGLEVSDWWPHVASCADDLSVVRSLWTTDAEHSAVLQFHTGRSIRLSREPSLGSWVNYGLGRINQNLPAFVVLGQHPTSFQGGPSSHQAQYLGTQYDGIPIDVDPARVLPYRPERVHASPHAQRREVELVVDLDRLAAAEYPDDRDLRARIESYELAFRLQSALPDVVRLDGETEETKKLYGMDDPVTRPFGEQCLVARRLAEQGVRFIQIYHGANPGFDAGDWDAHEKLRENHTRQCAKVDRPIAGLLRDLKRRGMFDRTLVVWATEFGRSPNIDIRTPCGPHDERVRTGRDHHIHGFSAWMAGAGIRPGVIHGATDELGFHAVESPHYVTDLHATVLHLMGLDSSRMEIPGHKRIERDEGKPIQEILA